MRYTGEVRVRLHGDREAGQLLVSQARTLLGNLMERNAAIAEGRIAPKFSDSGISNKQREPLDVVQQRAGPITVGVYGGVPIIDIFVPPQPLRGVVRLASRLIWLPEGFVIVPRHPVDAPDGWGVPDTKNKRGTPAGPLTEVIINHLRHNAYPDRLVQGLRSGPQDLIVTPIFFKDYEADEVGEALPGGGVLPQVDPRYEQRIFETPEDGWFCHRPQLVRYLGPDDEALPETANIRNEFLYDIFYGTNAVRAGQGLKAMLPPIRGWYDGTSRSVLQEVAQAGVMAHDSDKYREGYQTALERVYRFGQPVVYYGENLALIPSPDEGADFVTAWVNSPEHYLNMVTDWWVEEAPELGMGGFLDLAVSRATITEPTATTGVTASQMYLSAQRWVGKENRVWEGTAGRVSYAGGLNRYQPSNLLGLRTAASGFSGHMPVYFRGHGLYVPMSLGPRAHGLAACLIRDGDDRDLLVRIAYVTMPENAATAPELVIEDWRIDELQTEGAEPVSVLPYELPLNAGSVGVIFSPSGWQATIALYTYEAPPAGQFVRHNQTDFNNRVALPVDNMAPGAAVTHILFSGGVYSAADKQEVLVVPQDISQVSSYNRYHVKCEGSYVAYRDFVGETLVEAQVNVDWEIKQIDSAGGVTDFYAKALTEIVFPDASTFVCIDVEMDGDYEHQTGFVTVLRHMDIRHPEQMIYTRHDTSYTFQSGQRYPTLSQQLFFGSDLLSSIDNVMPRHEDLDGFSGLTRAPTTGGNVLNSAPVLYGVNPSTSAELRTCYFPLSSGAVGTTDAYGIANGDFCATTHHADLHGYSLANNTTFFPQTSARVSAVFAVAPRFTPGLGAFTANRVEYEGEHIVAASLGSVVGLPQYGLQGEDRFFYESSLDLEALTGVEGLSKNILPIGVI